MTCANLGGGPAPGRGGGPPAASAEGRVTTIFRSRLRPEAVDEYGPVAERMLSLARGMPGFVDCKTFVAEDGERVTIVVFATETERRAWGGHPEHVEAQRMGRERFYQAFSIEVCRSLRRWAGP